MSFFRRGRSFPLLSLLLALALVPVPPAQGAEKPKDSQPAVPADLPQRHREFLDQAAPLISEREREVFLGLGQEYQRDTFVRRFWQARDPFPQTARNEFQERWEERMRLAKDRYPDLTEDRARMLLVNGEPAGVVQSYCSDVLLPLEIWVYNGTERIQGEFSLVFYQPQGARGGRYRLWYPSEGIAQLLAFELRARYPNGLSLDALADACGARGDEVASALALSADWNQVEAKIQVIPRPGEEWLQTFVSYSTDLPAGAEAFPAELALSFPGRYQSRTVVQGLLSVPRDEVKPLQLEGFTGYSFLIDGEIVRKDELFEHFRYRFTLPEREAKGDRIPLVFQRVLRPGSYTLILKIEDTAGKRFYREERQLEVPAVTAMASGTSAEAAGGAVAAGPAPAAPNTADPLAEANAAVARAGDWSIRILPPPEGLMTGRARVEAAVTGEVGEGVARVSFLLNGRQVLSKSKPPYSVELNLGDQPRAHILQAVALGPKGEELARDELQLNVGPHRFAVRLVDPQPGKTYRASLRAQAEVKVPEGDELDRVELYLNDTLVATLYQPPFVQPVVLPSESQGLTYVRAVAYLADGNSAEDLVVVNAPDFHTEVEVDAVELYTTVVDRRGRPVEGLGRGEFQIFEDGVEQKVHRFEVVKDSPIWAGVLLDTSASMQEELEEAVRGALRFFQKMITRKDRAAVITFNDEPSLAVRFTNDQEVLAGGVANLAAEGNTALYDSLIYSLYYFGGIRGRRALVLLSDGKDEGSRYQFNEALDYARRTGVTIYAVGLNLRSQDADVRLKLTRLADETGGRMFFIERAAELDSVYQAIESDLRTQYLLVYDSSQAGGDREKFRSVEVKVGRPGLEAKTLRGYYP